MGAASYVQTSFLGGEISQIAQGHFDKPEYRMSMNVCLNGLPMEQGAWTRRPGFVFGAATNAGLPARVMSYSFQQNSPYTCEFTDGSLRFYSGYSLAMTNDAQAVSGITTASPAVVTTGTAHGWAASSTVMFNTLGTVDPLLMNRQFTMQPVVGQPTKFSLYDALSGTAVNGASLQAFTSGNVSRVNVLSTPYNGATWNGLQLVQGDGNGILLNGSVKPYVLNVTAKPSTAAFAEFTLEPAIFIDGPYLDYVSNGAEIVPNLKSGIINLTLAFAAWSSTTAYSIGDYTSSGGISYFSLADANFNNTPASSPSYWRVVSPSVAVGPTGFVDTDIGRHIRLSSEPPLWNSASTYNIGDTVTYDAQTYWTSLVATNINHTPGVDTVNWKLNPTGATWTWGKITGLLNSISGSVAGVAHIGNMTQGGGLAAAFDGTAEHNSTAAASLSQTLTVASGAPFPFTSWVGQNYSATVATGYAISSVTITPSSDLGLAAISFPSGVSLTSSFFQMQAYLYGSNSAPSGPTNGTLLASQTVESAANPYGVFNFPAGTAFAFGTSPITLVPSDTTTAFKYVWVYFTTSFLFNDGSFGNSAVIKSAIYTGQMRVNSSAASSSTAGVAVEVLGPPLLTTSAIRTWRLGLFNDATGWPTRGTYHEGRLWLGGSVNNRFDASQPNQEWASEISFSPTQYDGTVTDANAISYTLNAPSTNTILWFKPDLQGVIVGTEKGEWLIFATTLNSPLSPLNITAHLVTKMGSSIASTALPVETEHTTVFIQRYARKLIEYFTDVFSGKFTAPDIAESASHLTSSVAPIVEVAYQQNISPNIWARTQDGRLIGCAYKRDSLMSSQGPSSKGWHRHLFGSGRLIASLTSGPTPDGTLDTPVVVTAPVIAGDSYHVCFMNRLFEETDVGSAASYLDEAVSATMAHNVTQSGDLGTVLSGLWHLNGKLVTAFIEGLDCGDYTVASGAIFVPYGPSSAQQQAALFTAAFAAAAETAIVGFTYTSQGQIVRPNIQAETGTRGGTGFGKKRRSHRMTALLSNTQGISFGTTFALDADGNSQMNRANFVTPGNTSYATNELYSGVWEQFLTDIYSFDSMVCWQISRPYPATIAALGVSLETQDQ